MSQTPLPEETALRGGEAAEAIPRRTPRRRLAADKPRRLVAIVESLLTAAIWASSFVVVKVGLNYAGPLTTAGLRYFLAFLVLLPFAMRDGHRIRSVPPRLWLRLFGIGLSAYTIGNGALFWGLKYVPATTASFLLSFSPLLILVAGVIWLKEIPGRLQIAGLIISLIGGGLFFAPGLQPGEPLGVGIIVAGLFGFAAFGILGRAMARNNPVGTINLTAFPLAFGGGLLLLIAFIAEGLPRLPPIAWGIVLWLAVVNTALAYVLYNHALQSLTALEMNVMLNLSPLGTAILAWLVLGESLSGLQLAGIITVIGGVILVQWKPATPISRT